MEPLKHLLRELPSVDRLLKHPGSEALLARFRRDYVTRRYREALEELRRSLRQGKSLDPNDLKEDAILTRVANLIASQSEANLTPVVNATGTVLHTNLGRALLPKEAIEAVVQAGTHPVNLEYDLARGKRGKREESIEEALIELTGAEAATVVNNNAAAVLLGLNTLAFGKEVIVSRGELIEIGGSFRIPEIMAKSGAILKEVGSTNRTHSRDYERAIGKKTGLLLKVHASNYRIVGFSAEVELEELVAMGKKHKIPVMEDLGSGAFIDLGKYGLPREPVVAEQVAKGADIVTFSGDKILGGPQAGLVVGKARWIGQMNRNPLKRALRCGKLTLAALESVLRLYRQAPDVVERIPTLKAFTHSPAAMEETGREAMARLDKALGEGYHMELRDSGSEIGSGALPTEEIPTKVIAIRHRSISAGKIAGMFRASRPPILGRVKDNRFLLDLRGIFDPEDLVPKPLQNPR